MVLTSHVVLERLVARHNFGLTKQLDHLGTRKITISDLLNDGKRRIRSPIRSPS